MENEMNEGGSAPSAQEGKREPFCGYPHRTNYIDVSRDFLGISNWEGICDYPSNCPEWQRGRCPFAPNSKRVLWLSRHAPTNEQVDALAQVLGPIKILQVSKTVSSGKEVKDLLREHQCDEVVAVLPLNILQQVIAQGIQPIRAVMSRELKENGEAVFHFQHFERVLEVTVKAKKL